MSLWIVGICYRNGAHQYICFGDHEDDAKLAAANLIGHPDLKVFCWDAFADKHGRPRQT